MPLDNGVFNFWKDNRVDGFFQLTEGELSIKFIEWMNHQSTDRLSYYSTSDNVAMFIADKEHGLSSMGNSDHEFAEYRSMEKLLKSIIKAHLSGHEMQYNLSHLK